MAVKTALRHKFANFERSKKQIQYLLCWLNLIHDHHCAQYFKQTQEYGMAYDCRWCTNPDCMNYRNCG